MTAPTKKAAKKPKRAKAGPPEHSTEAIQAHPAPDRGAYPTGKDYAAACKQVNEARVLFDKKLTPKQQRFVEEYLVDMNAGAAYRRAGYECKNDNVANVNGHLLISNHKIAAIISEATKKYAAITGLTVERTLQEVARLAYADPRRLYDKDGNFIPVYLMDDDTAATVAGIEVEEILDGKGESRTLAGHLRKVKTHDKNAALEKAMKYHGLYVERAELKITHSYQERLERARKRVNGGK